MINRYRNRQQAVRQMDEWGREKRPFFFMVDFDGTSCLVLPLDEIDPEELLYDFRGVTNEVIHEENRIPETLPSLEWHPEPEEYACYRQSFDQVFGELHAGNSFLTNLTVATPVHTNWSLRQIYRAAKAPYRLWVKDRFVVFSPEIFVQVADGRIRSFPMKGTLDARLPNAEERLRHDPKERAEHATITDLIRNDLSRVAQQVTVDRYAYMDKIRTHRGPLLQMSSEISGTLTEEYRDRLGSILFELLPAGSITGAPKEKTVEIIRRAERHERGFYTGVTGIFDGERLDSAVMIRFVEQMPDGSLCYKSGGGITFQSEPEKEYQEVIQKIYVPVYGDHTPAGGRDPLPAGS